MGMVSPGWFVCDDADGSADVIVFFVSFFVSSFGGWLKIKVKLPHYTVVCQLNLDVIGGSVGWVTVGTPN